MKKSPSSPPDSDPLYNEEILNYGKSHGQGTRLPARDITAEDIGALCGSRIIMDVVWAKGSSDKKARRIGGLGYRVEACALGTASAAICADAAIDADESEILEIYRQMKKMLKGEDFCFNKKPHWEKLSLLRAARRYPSRHAAILLPLCALLKAFKDNVS